MPARLSAASPNVKPQGSMICAGVPHHVHDAVAARVAIPMQPGFRSLNVAVAAGIALAEALRQTKGFPA